MPALGIAVPPLTRWCGSCRGGIAEQQRSIACSVETASAALMMSLATSPDAASCNSFVSRLPISNFSFGPTVTPENIRSATGSGRPSPTNGVGGGFPLAPIYGIETVVTPARSTDVGEAEQPHRGGSWSQHRQHPHGLHRREATARGWRPRRPQNARRNAVVGPRLGGACCRKHRRGIVGSCLYKVRSGFFLLGGLPHRRAGFRLMR